MGGLETRPLALFVCQEKHHSPWHGHVPSRVWGKVFFTYVECDKLFFCISISGWRDEQVGIEQERGMDRCGKKRGRTKQSQGARWRV